MKIRYSRSRTLLLALLSGVTIANVYATLSQPLHEIPAVHLEAVPLKLPEAESDTPIIVRVCREFRYYDEGFNGYIENGRVYFDKEKGVNCVISAGSHWTMIRRTIPATKVRPGTSAK